MDKLRILWTHPQVAFSGRGISEAWAEAMENVGFEITQDPALAEMAFFVSDSQLSLNPDVIGKLPTVAFFWGWPPGTWFRPEIRADREQKLRLLGLCTRVLAPSLSTLYQLADFNIDAQLCLAGVDAKTLGNEDLLPERKLQAVWLSRIEPHKGLEDAIQAVSILQPKLPLLVLGPGNRTSYERMAKETGADVCFLEPTDAEKVQILRESAVMLCTSRYEGWGLPPLEALYCGTPVIAFDTPHLRWLLQEDALYYSSIEGLVGSIVEVLNNYEKYSERTANGCRRVRTSLTLKAASERLWAHLHQAHKEFWAGKVKADPRNLVLVKEAYEAEHRRNWAYGLTDIPGYSAPARFDPTWSRHWRAQHFIKALREAKAKRIIDIGSSSVYPTIFARAGFQVTGLDVADEALRQAREIAVKWGVSRRVKLQQGVAQDLPFPEGSFDSVVLGEILEHVPDPERVLEEALRVCKEGGIVVCSTPVEGHHMDPFHIASEYGGWTDALLSNLLMPYAKDGMVDGPERIAEEGTEPSCFFFAIKKAKVDYGKRRNDASSCSV